jgi:hypothetical protein
MSFELLLLHSSAGCVSSAVSSDALKPIQHAHCSPRSPAAMNSLFYVTEPTWSYWCCLWSAGVLFCVQGTCMLLLSDALLVRQAADSSEWARRWSGTL